jgi:hypothetical protein
MRHKSSFAHLNQIYGPIHVAFQGCSNLNYRVYQEYFKKKQKMLWQNLAGKEMEQF